MAIQAIGGSTSIDFASLSRLQSTSTTTAANASSKTSSAKAGGTAPASNGGGGGASAAASSTSTTTSASAARIYDPMDLNQDGVVSFRERLQYMFENPNVAAQSQSALAASQQQSAANTSQQGQSTATASQLQSGLNAYLQGQQAQKPGGASLLIQV